MAEKTSQQVQQGRLKDHEKELIQKIFKDNEGLLLALRNLLFGFKLTDEEKVILQILQGTPIRQLLRKILLPELERDIPIGQAVDLWMTVKLDVPERDKTVIKARDTVIENLETSLAALEKLDNSKVSLEVVRTTEGLMARNTFIQHVELQLLAIRAIANEKLETDEERQERQKKDSVK